MLQRNNRVAHDASMTDSITEIKSTVAAYISVFTNTRTDQAYLGKLP